MKQFIKTTDKQTADKLMLSGFNLVSHVGGLYIYLNQPPKNFNFEAIDQKTIAYDNILSL